jgi:hypothetical protein
MAIIGLILLGYFMFAWRQSLPFKGGIVTDGVVVASVEASSTNDTGGTTTRYFPVVEFRSADGRLFRAKSKVSTFRPGNPRRVHLVDPVTQNPGLVAVGTIGALLFVICSLVFAF